VAITDLSVTRTSIDGLAVVALKEASDERGAVREFFRRSAWTEAGLPDLGAFQQVNVTESRRGAVRGLHGEAMTKVVTMAAGEGFGAYVDARPGSVTFGAVETVALRPGVQVVVPEGVCNGFQTTSETSQFLYCFDTEWRPGMPGVAVNPLDPSLAIPWPIGPDDGMLLSEKDRTAPMLDRSAR
jgi:dTDP-4-dehydrorhamnose 3,5-epimerase